MASLALPHQPDRRVAGGARREPRPSVHPRSPDAPRSADPRAVREVEAPGRYQPSRRGAPAAFGAALAVVAALGSAFVLMDGPHLARAAKAPMMVTLDLLPPPPPATPETPQPRAEIPPPAAPEVAAPVPVVAVAPPRVVAALPPVVPSPPIVAVAPVAPAPVASLPAAPAPVASSGVEKGDLSMNMLSATPPSYPTESRRRKEQGVVRLSVLVGTDGRVSDIDVSGSSGSDRLDRAALSAVKRWRWSPLLRSGVPVMVRGIVTIPFVLRG